MPGWLGVLMMVGFALVLALVVHMFGAKSGFIVLALAGACAVALIHPLSGLLVLLVFWPVIGNPEGVGLAEISYGSIFAATFLGWLFKLLTGKGKLPPSPVYKPTALLFLLAVGSILLAGRNDTPFMAWLRSFVPFTGLLMIFVAASELTSRQHLRLVALALYLAALASFARVFITVAEAFPISLDVWNPALIRLALPHQVYGGGVLAGASLAFGYLVAPAGRGRLIHLALLALFSFGLAFLFLRSTLVIAAAVAAAGIYLSVRYGGGVSSLARRLVPGAILLGGLPLVAYFSQPVRSVFEIVVYGYKSRLESLGLGLEARWAEFAAVLKIFKESPFLGMGLGFEYSFSPGPELLWTVRFTHNIISYFLLTTGALGLLLLLWLAGSATMEFAKGFKRFNRQDTGLLTAFALAWLSLSLYTLVNTVFLWADYFLLLSVLTAAAIRMNVTSKE